MDLGQAMRAWEEMRDELERKLRATYMNVMPETRVRLEAQLAAVTTALDLCRDPNGPIPRRSIEDLVRERQALLNAACNTLEGYDLDIPSRIQGGLEELRLAVATAHDTDKPFEQEELF